MISRCSFFVAAFLLACTTPDARTMDAQQNVVVSVQSPVFAFDPATKVLKATLPVNIENVGSEPVFFEFCGTGVEQAVGSGWRGVWVATCTLQTRPPVEIAPGAKYSWTYEISGVVGSGMLINWTEPVGGEYRVRVALGTTKGQVPESERISRSFTVQVQ